MKGKGFTLTRVVCSIVLLLMATACGAVPTPTPVPTATKAPAPAAPTAAPAVPTATPPPAPTATTVAAVQGGKLVFGMQSQGNSMDPHATTGIRQVLFQVFDTLIYQAADGSFVPGLATDWKVSPDGLTWTFKLRSGVKFHDGTPFNAEAVKFNFERILDPATKATYSKSYVGTFQAATVVDPLTVQLAFSQPFPPFLVNLTRPFLSMVSPTAAQKLGADFGRNPVGTGPFMFKEWVDKDHITLVKNPDYNWAPTIFKHQGAAYLDELRYVLVPENAARVTALETGQVNAIERVPELEFDRLKADVKYATMVAPLTGMPFSIFINTEKPILSDLKVRQALEYGFDRASFIKAQYNNAYPAATGPLIPSVLYYDSTADNMYPYDANKAKALLEEAGWKLGPDGIRQKDGKPLELNFYDCAQRGAEVIQAQLKQIGVKMNVHMNDCPAHVELANKGEHDLAVQGPLSNDPDVFELYFHSRNIGGAAWTRFRSAELDTLIDKGRIEMNPAERQKIYSQIQHIIMDNALIIPINMQAVLVAMQANLAGAFPSNDGLGIYMYDVQFK
jgi:peptide/nickel transport system substrate-binding protein